ncbi:hypothetical protein IGI04_024327 [Brassica rapa subsp. trilocularis]|uniref:Uncharacterized protein n=1 Tax=Brassica rapa subsp. trilocularis TaxID=1813537 RepID=A0ABQ7M9T9_BRACM|nr:hypothetical protein IGI04_024327 [Brassica rapa subsp. trilocularis]
MLLNLKASAVDSWTGEIRRRVVCDVCADSSIRPDDHVLEGFLTIILGFRTFVWTAVSYQLKDRHQFFLAVQNIGSAMADVVIDAMIAEKASFSDLQSVSGCAMAVGGICGSLLGGYALNNLKMETICLLFTVLPVLQLLPCALLEEIPSSNEPFPEMLEEKRNDNYRNTNKSNTRRRKKGQKQKKKGRRGGSDGILSERQKKQSKLFQSLKSATSELCRAFKQPIILRLIHALLINCVLFGSALTDTINQLKYVVAFLYLL